MECKVPLNFLSFDVEDWFAGIAKDSSGCNTYSSRIKWQLERVVEILDRYNTKATFFVLGETAVKNQGAIRLLADSGHEIASHGMKHRFISKLTPDEFYHDTSESVKSLTDTCGRKLAGYRAPFFSITKANRSWVISMLNELGFRYDSSIFPVHNHRYGIPDAPRRSYILEGTNMMEFPPASVCFGRVGLGLGGAYFRLLPFAFIRNSIREMNALGCPTVLYLHPWEFDPHHSRIRCAPFLRFRHYYKLSQTARRLEALLKEFRFIPLNKGLNGGT